MSISQINFHENFLRQVWQLIFRHQIVSIFPEKKKKMRIMTSARSE